MNPKSINELVSKVLEALPDGVKQLPDDMKQHMRSAVTSAFEKMDLVTREEFEAQQKVLQRTRQKLQELETVLEKHLSGKG